MSGDNRCRHPLDPLVEVLARLRAPDGCPWDQRQTPASLRPYLIEETYEAIDAIDSGNPDKIREELGDVLLQVVFHAQIAAEAGSFTIDDVVRTVVDKMIRRHPHVFGDVDAPDVAAVLENWEAIKRRETADQAADPPQPDKQADIEPQDPGSATQARSLLAGVPRHLPALMEAHQVQARAARVGFQWDDMAGAIRKVWEEAREVGRARKTGTQAQLEEEWGDMLFALVNVSRYMEIDAEQALRAANRKFRRRFQYIEAEAEDQDLDLDAMTLEEMDALWNAAKQQETKP